jgi:DNA-binding NtrC family response regulator
MMNPPALSDSARQANGNEPVRPAVLFVDDEESYVSLMIQLLGNNLHCPILTYTKPREALVALSRLDIGMIVTDYSMPAMNGLDFIRQAAAIAPLVPVIMVSGHTVEISADERDAYPNLKATLAKPFRWRALAEEIIRHWVAPHPPILREEAVPD